MYMEKNNETKICKCCNKELPIDNFDLHRRSKDGHVHICKQCKLNVKANTMFSNVSSRELIEELKKRGYTGTLNYTEKRVINI